MTENAADPVQTPAAAPAPVRGASPGLDLWSKPTTRWLALLTVTVVVAYLCWLMLAPFVDVLMWAIVLVVVFYPVHRRLLVRIKSSNWAAAASCLLVILTILLPLAVVTALVVRDAGDLARSIPAKREAFLHADSTTSFGRAMAWVDANITDIDRFRSQEYLAERVRGLSGMIATRTLNVVGGLLGAVVQIFFVIFTMFYLFRDGESLRRSLRHALPLDRWQSHEVFLRTKDVIQASVYGSLVIAAVQGTLGGIAFAVLGVPSPVLWGAVMILLCMIPMAGAFLVWGPAAVYLAVTGHYYKAIILTVWGAVVIGTIDNVLRPRLVGERTRMHELVIFFSVLGGLQVFGVLGIITGPAVAAVAIALFEIWKQAKPQAAVAGGGVAVVAEPAPQAAAPGVVRDQADRAADTDEAVPAPAGERPVGAAASYPSSPGGVVP